MYNIPMLFFCLRHQGGRRCRITLECKEKVYFFRSGPYAMLFYLGHHACYSNRLKLFAIQWCSRSVRCGVVEHCSRHGRRKTLFTYTSSGSKSLCPISCHIWTKCKTMHFTRADLHAWPFSQTQTKGLVYYNGCTKSLDYTRTRDEGESCCRRTANGKHAWRYPVTYQRQLATIFK